MSLRKHTLYNLMGALLPMGVSLVTIPIYIRLIGDARYGILAVVWLFLGYFGLFDLGLGSAVAQRIAASANAPPKQIASIFWTALAINGAFGALGALLIWPTSHIFFDHVISTDAKLRSELLSALPWLIFSVPLMTLTGVLGGSLQGRSQFLELNIITVASSILLQTFPLFVAWVHGPDLAWLLPSAILIRVLSFCLIGWRCKVHVFQDYAPSFSREIAKGLVSFGGWVTVTSLVGPLMVSLDRLVIGATLGPKSVTYYTVPFQLAARTNVLPVALTSALFPRLAMAHTIYRIELATRAVRSLAVVMTPLMMIALLLVEPFFRFWISPDFAANANVVAQVLFLSYWINGFALVPYAQLQSTGRPDITAKLHVAELIPYLMLLFAALHFWGLPGAALVFGLRNLADCVLLMWYAGILRSAAKILSAAVSLLFGAVGVALGLAVGSAAWWSASSTLLLVTVAWSWWCAPVDVREFAVRILKNFAIRLRVAFR